MKLTAKIKLDPNKDQRTSLFKTFTAFNTAANIAAKCGFENRLKNQACIQKICYYDIRKKLNLSSQLTIRAIGKAVECLKIQNKTCPLIKDKSAIVYDQRIMSFKNGDNISLSSIDGRITIKAVIGEFQKKQLQSAIKTGQADLIITKGVFYLLISYEAEQPPKTTVTNVLGVDMGVVNIAVDSNGTVYTGRDVENTRQWFQNRRNILQSIGTKSSKRRLKLMSGKEANYRRTKNHQVSRSIIDTAKGTNSAIAIEELNGINRRTRFSKEQRSRMGGWAYAQLAEFIQYKANMEGIHVIIVNPRNTSRTCCQCGHINKNNRVSQSVFFCKTCGHTTNADINAAINISKRGYVSGPMVETKAKPS